MQKNIFLAVISTAIIAGGAAFYGGIKYGKGGMPDFRSLTPEQRQQRFQQLGIQGIGGTGGRFGNSTGNNFAVGEIISKDDKSITLKLRDGGSKIVFFSDSTEISKFADGDKNDLQVGKNILVNGKTNSDGSLTAQTIQLRPEIQAAPQN